MSVFLYSSVNLTIYYWHFSPIILPSKSALNDHYEANGMILCTYAYYGNNWGMKIRSFELKVRFNMVRYKWTLLYKL